jgi:heavy metal-binding protein
MKNKILLLPLLLIIVLSVASCSSGDKKTEENAGAEVQGKVPKEITDMTGVASYYECPMKCEGKKFADAGVCPVCGMDLVLVEVKADSTAVPADTAHQM